MRPEAVAPGVLRLIAPNPGPLTFRGTNCYLVGGGPAVLVDPGPDDPAHVASLLAVLAPGGLSHILVTHAHRDHSGAAPAIALATGAPVLAAGRAGPSRELSSEESFDDGIDRTFSPDRRLADGEVIGTPAGRFRVVATPGHAADHLAFVLDERLVFSGDHVMGWSTAVVVPPDGSMADYMRSLDRLGAEPARLYLPGHGDAIEDGPARCAELATHRRAREAAILAAATAGAASVEQIVTAVYVGLDPALRPAAAASVRAHLEKLTADGALAAGSILNQEARARPRRVP